MNNTDNKLIPVLRFPEFENSEEWGKKTLDEVAKFRRGSFPQPYGLPEWYDQINGMPFIQVFDVNDNFRLKSKTKSKISKLAAEQSVFIPKDTVIITIQGSIGRVAITQYDAYIDRTLLLFEKFFVDIDKTFFAYVLFMLFEIEKQKAPGGIIKTITKEDLSEFEIKIPSLNEQQKIADCLSSLDDLITAHSDKLDALKEHKKGLMQNLFPQEGETEPKLRFREFEKDGEWEVKELDEVCKLVRGPFGGALKKEIFVKEGYAVYEQSHAIYSDFNAFRYYINEEKYNELKRFSVKSGDLIMSCSGTMGKFALIPNDFKFGVINQALLKLTTKKDFNNLFVKITLELEKNQNNLLSQSAGGAIKNVVSVAQIKELKLLMPKPKEQQKIAETISSLDELIIEQTEKVEQLKQHKKGLMQGLFPKIKE